VRDVVVVLRADLEEAARRAQRLGARVLVNPDPDGEMMESIRMGVAALRPSSEAVFVWPADHPAVQAATISALASVAEPGAVWIPCWKGRRGHPALVGSALRQDLVAASAPGGLRDLWRTRAAAIRELAVEDPGVVTNIDTPEQYEAASRND